MRGAIIGDVCASVYEHDNLKTEKFFEIPLDRPDCRFTDDTVLTCAVADACMGDGDYAAALRRWGRKHRNAGYGGRFIQWLRADDAGPYNSFGNGSAMRVSAIGWLYGTLEETLAEAERSAAVTHNHPEGVKGAQAVAAAIFWARIGRSKKSIRRQIAKRFGYDLDRTVADIRKTYAFDVSCQDSVPEALIAFLEGQDFTHTLRLAISLGGDSDTIACIAGSVAEAYYGTVPEALWSFAEPHLTDDIRDLLARFDRRRVSAVNRPKEAFRQAQTSCCSGTSFYASSPAGDASRNATGPAGSEDVLSRHDDFHSRPGYTLDTMVVDVMRCLLSPVMRRPEYREVRQEIQSKLEQARVKHRHASFYGCANEVSLHLTERSARDIGWLCAEITRPGNGESRLEEEWRREEDEHTIQQLNGRLHGIVCTLHGGMRNIMESEREELSPDIRAVLDGPRDESTCRRPSPLSRDGMWGAILGDFYGSIYEFNNRKTDAPEEIDLLNSRCRFTDDTTLTVATMDALLGSSLNAGDYAEAYRDWGRRYPDGNYGLRFVQWLRRGLKGPYNSLGNGSAMRISPVGWAYDTLEETLLAAELSAEVTHNHPEGIKGAQATATAVFLARTGKTKPEIKTYVEQAFGYDLSRTVDAIRPGYRFDETCRGTVPEALIVFLENRDFAHALQLAISLGGDSDTLACIAGGVAGAFYREIPADLLAFAKQRLDPERLETVEQFQHEYR